MLNDDSPEVRAMSARSLGWLGSKRSFDLLNTHLLDADATVRLHVLSAMERLDVARLKTQAVIVELQKDPDAKVSAAANRVMRP